jgi:ABC-type glycerol-3-phosphate transport system substrate-binding protein
MKRSFFCCVLFFLAFPVLFTFAGGAKEKATGKPFEGVTITACSYEGPEVESYRALSSIWEDKTGGKVVWEPVPFEKLHARYSVELAGKTGVYDVITYPINWRNEFAAAGYLNPLYKLVNEKWTPAEAWVDPSEVIKLDDFLPRLFKAHMMYQNVVYGLSLIGHVQVYMGRKDLFEKYADKFEQKYGYKPGVPKTWEQYAQQAEFFTFDWNNDGQTEYGTVDPSKRGDAAVCGSYWDMVWAFGGEYIDPKTLEPTLNSPQVQQATQFFIDKIEPYNPPGFEAYWWFEALDLFNKGKVAQMIMWNSLCADTINPQKSSVADKVVFGPMPRQVSGGSNLGGWVLSIPKDAKQKEAAWSYISWLTSPEMQAKTTLKGGMPTRTSVFLDPQVKAIPYVAASLEGLKDAHCRPFVPEWSEMEEELGAIFNSIISKQVPIKEGLDQANAKEREILERAGYYKLSAQERQIVASEAISQSVLQ